jgi:Holliday junction resolvase RusA-like endonuclease
VATYRLEILNWHPASANMLDRNRWVRYSCKKRDAKMVRGYALAGQVPPATCKRRVSVTLEYSTRRWHMDPENAQKSLLDALVNVGLLVDDNQKWKEMGVWESVRTGRAATVIVLEDC